MICTKCGEQNQEDACFCFKCGNPVVQKCKTTEGTKTKRRALIPIIVVLCAIACVVWLGQRHYHRTQPVYVFEIMAQIHSPADVDRYSEFFTPKGKEVFKWMKEKDAESPVSKSNDKTSEPVVVGDTCSVTTDISTDNSHGVLIIQLKKGERWQFDDVYLKTIDDKNIELWASYIKDHPVLTLFKLHWRELTGACFKGFVIGATAAGG